MRAVLMMIVLAMLLSTSCCRRVDSSRCPSRAAPSVAGMGQSPPSTNARPELGSMPAVTDKAEADTSSEHRQSVLRAGLYVARVGGMSRSAGIVHLVLAKDGSATLDVGYAYPTVHLTDWTGRYAIVGDRLFLQDLRSGWGLDKIENRRVPNRNERRRCDGACTQHDKQRAVFSSATTGRTRAIGVTRVNRVSPMNSMNQPQVLTRRHKRLPAVLVLARMSHEARRLLSQLLVRQRVVSTSDGHGPQHAVLATDSDPRSKRRFRSDAPSIAERFSAKRSGSKTSENGAIRPVFMKHAG